MKYSGFLIFCFVLLKDVFGGLEVWPIICPDIVSRSSWNSRKPIAIDYAIIPVPNVIIHHTVTRECDTEKTCAATVKSIQNFHMEKMEFPDIGYNFLVGGDGQIYEGAGWHKVGAHTRGYNSRSLGLAFIGNFSDTLPNERQLNAAHFFLGCAVGLGEVDKNYKLFGARQVSATASPGLRLYHEIKTWPHFTDSPL